MNYLLVMPREASKASTSLAVMFPIGLAYISASLKSGGHNVTTVNLEYQEGDAFGILSDLVNKKGIDVVCTGGLSLDCHKIMEVLKIIEKINPRIITVVGGGIISSDPVTSMRVLNADIGVIGQGEVTICELAEALDNGLPYFDIPGLIFKDKDGTFRITPQRSEITNLDSISFPDFDFGDRNETKETASNTITFWKKHIHRDYVNLSMISTYQGTPLYKYACSSGLIEDKDKFLLDGCPLINVSKLTDSEYDELRSRITELRLHAHVLCTETRIIDIQDDGKCSIEFKCRRCGTVHSADVFFWFKIESVCSCCGLINEVDPFEVALHKPEQFFSNLPDAGHIALWGAGGIFYKLACRYSHLSSDRFTLVDVDTQLEGLSICSRKVHSPAAISEGGIDTVIITALSRKDEIYDTICRDYACVQNVFAPAFSVKSEGVVPYLRLQNGAARESVI